MPVSHRKDYATVVWLVSSGRTLESDAGINNTSLNDKQREKRNDRARGHEHHNRMRWLDFLQYADLVCAEDVLKTFELSLHGETTRRETADGNS